MIWISLLRVPRLTIHNINDNAKTPLFSLGEIIANVMADDKLLSKMTFSSVESRETTIISEIWQSVKWNEIVLSMNKKNPDSLPIVILLFYDDFRKYKFVPGSCGGMYVSILNLERKLLSKPKNMFCLGLISSEEEFWDVMENVVSQLETLYRPHYTETSKGLVKVSCRLGMFLADTPQRNELCNMKAHNADTFCIHCMTNRQSCLKVPSHLDKNGVTRDIRTVSLTKTQIQEYLHADTSKKREDIEKEYGLNPRIVNGHYIPNPFYRLNDMDLIFMEKMNETIGVHPWKR